MGASISNILDSPTLAINYWSPLHLLFQSHPSHSDLYDPTLLCCIDLYWYIVTPWRTISYRDLLIMKQLRSLRNLQQLRPQQGKWRPYYLFAPTAYTNPQAWKSDKHNDTYGLIG